MEKAQSCLLQIIDLYNAGVLDGIDVVDDMKMLGDIYMYENDSPRAQLFYKKALLHLEKSLDFGETHPKTLAMHQLVIESSTQ